MHGDDLHTAGDSDDSHLFRKVLQQSDLWLQTTSLSSQTRGEVSSPIYSLRAVTDHTLMDRTALHLPRTGTGGGLWHCRPLGTDGVAVQARRVGADLLGQGSGEVLVGIEGRERLKGCTSCSLASFAGRRDGEKACSAGSLVALSTWLRLSPRQHRVLNRAPSSVFCRAGEKASEEKERKESYLPEKRRKLENLMTM